MVKKSVNVDKSTKTSNKSHPKSVSGSTSKVLKKAISKLVHDIIPKQTHKSNSKSSSKKKITTKSKPLHKTISKSDHKPLHKTISKSDHKPLHKTISKSDHKPLHKTISKSDHKPLHKTISKPNKSVDTHPKQIGADRTIKMEYDLIADNVPARVTIYTTLEEYVPIYDIKRALIQPATRAIVDKIREEIISSVDITTKEFVDPQAIITIKKRFMERSYELIDKYLPGLSKLEMNLISGNLIHEMLGLGDIELLLNDDNLEEIVVNSSSEPVWVYHKRFGWVKTNILFKSEEMIYNYAGAIGRKVGRQITNLHPLMDAYLTTGDRVNATISPISSQGNTLTIRRFSRDPWTIVHLIDPKINTLSKEVAALLWLALQYELNILVVGGTASGKTSLLNALIPFIPPNQRIISIEDTREIQLPKFLHWVPLSAREANAEGQGKVSMLDLLVNSLRMRPDRIIIGEIRRRKEAEVMFEAIRTGHSAYATFHSDRAEQAYQRLINPPMNLPASLISALHLMVVQYRQRRMGVRRTLEVAEIVPVDVSNEVNVVYKWDVHTDTFIRKGRLIRLINEINLYTGMNETEIEENLVEKQIVLQWMLDKGIKDINNVGKIIAEYYRDEGAVVKLAKSNGSPEKIIGIN
ncbi:MAG: Flp pilus assembly complex ATPase component TadA [DPANN group archaeon]|nr:Flp pilus assembly complex ATPase component TadA [DPANN group archaeon]